MYNVNKVYNSHGVAASSENNDNIMITPTFYCLKNIIFFSGPDTRSSHKDNKY